MRKTRILWLLLSTVLTVACTPEYGVVRQAVPDPFLRRRHFQLVAISFEGTKFIKRFNPIVKAPEQAEAELQEALVAMREKYVATLREQLKETGVEIATGDRPDASAYRIEPHVLIADTGLYVGKLAGEHELRGFYQVRLESQTKMSIRIVAPGGTSYDEIVVDHHTDGNAFYQSAASRLGHDGAACAMATAAHLMKRIEGGD